MSSGTLVYRAKCFGDDAKPQYLIDVVRSCYDDDKKTAGLDKLIDPDIKDDTHMKSFHMFNTIAHECLTLKVEKRPTMERIIRKIQQALDIQLNQQELPSTITTRSLESFLIPLKEINMATEYFNLKTCITSDEFGAVRKSQLYSRWENRTMAIKRLYPKIYQREQAFYNELRIISSFHHQNISRFIGYNDEANERIIVHEHAINGNVDNHLEDWNKTPHLTWAKRLKICIGAAKGLRYLHLALGEDNEATRGFINTRNILLDENMEAKVSFFGLSKQGHMDPKPGKHISRLQKSDMYSFGVIMFEMLSGWRAHELSNIKYPEDQINLLQKYYHNNELDQFIDGYIRDQIDSRCLNIFKDIAYQCIMRDNQIKPSWMGPLDTRDLRASFNMDKVIERLEDAADFQGVEV